MSRLTVSYDGDQIVNTSRSGHYELATDNKILSGNVSIDFTAESFGDDEAFAHAYKAEPFTYNLSFMYPYTFIRAPITEFYAPNLIYFTDSGSGETSGGVGSYVFYRCTNLRKVDMPIFRNGGSGGYQFAYCTALADVNMPFGNVGQHMFDHCTSLQCIVLPHMAYPDSGANLNGYGFSHCSKLTAVDLGNVTRVHTSEFNNASKLDTLIIRWTDSVCTLSNTNAFTGTPFASGGSGGTLYVPSALVSSYQSDTNWGTILGYANNNILAIEDSVYEDKYADGTDIPQEESE